jgi:hypothetical protein
MQDIDLRRWASLGLNNGEARNALARAVFFHRLGELRVGITGALLDRLTHHVHILIMNGDSYRLKQSKRRQRGARSAQPPDNRTKG